MSTIEIIDETPQPEKYVPIVSSESSNQDLEDEHHEYVGWEYDEFVETYKRHPRNRLRVRYARDCDGFDVEDLKPFNSEIASHSDDETSLFSAYMKQFPLIDNLQHQQLLKRKIEIGKDAHETLTSSENLDPELSKELERLAIDGAGSYLTMFECNLRLVMSIAGKQKESSSYSVGDAIGDGCLGLRRAIQKYDPEKGFKFSTYATGWIRQSIQRRHMAVAYGASIPSGVYNGLRQIVKDRDTASENGTKITNTELIESGHSIEDILSVERFFSLGRTSLDASINNHMDYSLEDVLPSPDSEFEEAVITDEASRTLLGEMIKSGYITDTRDLIIFALLDGVVMPGVDYQQLITIDGHETATIGEYVMKVRSNEIVIGRKDLVKVLGISRERIRQVYDSTRAHMLAMTSIDSIGNQANISDEQIKDIKEYTQFIGYGGQGIRTSSRNINDQNRAQKVVESIRSSDLDFDDAIYQTMNILRDRFNLEDATLDCMELWLKKRYGFEKDVQIPLTQSKAKTAFGFSPTKVVVIESVFLAVLSDTWGKVPESVAK